MTIKCEQLDDLLLDATPLSMELAARHAEECASCAATLAAWYDLSSTAASLRTTWTNDTLWPRIERAIRAERKRSTPRWLWQAAAAVVLTVGLGGTMFQLVRQQTREAAFDRTILQISAMDEVERAERAHVQAIESLEELADARLDDAGTPLMISYKEKLMLLDDAIAECQSNIDRNRQNAHLRRQLLAMYSDKQQTLQEVLREDSTHATP
jgi:predicted transcriptional regulator